MFGIVLHANGVYALAELFLLAAAIGGAFATLDSIVTMGEKASKIVARATRLFDSLATAYGEAVACLIVGAA